jgi:hypothetical protein
MKMGRMIKFFVFVLLFMVSLIGSVKLSITPAKAAELPYPGYPFVSVYPDNETCSVNETFTVSVIVCNLTNAQVPDPYKPTAMISLGNLYGFDVQLTWDPSIIHCVNHTVAVPFENYSAPIPPSPYSGVLHSPIIPVVDAVNESGIVSASTPDVYAFFAYASMAPASAFNGNGTIATMTFKVLKEGESPLQIVSATLADVNATTIGYSEYSGRWLNPPHSGTVYAGPLISEFPLATILSLVLIIPLFMVILKKKRRYVET